MQTTTLKTAAGTPSGPAVGIRPRPAQKHVVPPAAVYKPPSKWTVVAAFVAAIALHGLAVVYFGSEPKEPTFDLGGSGDSSVEVTLEAAPPEPPEPPAPEEETPLDAPPAPVETPDFREETVASPPKKAARTRAVAPIARTRGLGGAGGGGSMSISSAKAVALYAPRPVYPYEARRARITGSGVVIMTVDPSTGSVTRAVMAQSTGSAILDNAATSAFRGWRFKPGTVRRVRVPITFTMSGAQY